MVWTPSPPRLLSWRSSASDATAMPARCAYSNAAASCVPCSGPQPRFGCERPADVLGSLANAL
eukprot:3801888-Pyramimonas_sp.AAC.1